MRTINIITTEQNVVGSIETFAIHEEQLSDEVVEKAEERFSEILTNMGADTDEIENLIVVGFYENQEFAVNLVWSDIN